jgi:hypothetical protein
MPLSKPQPSILIAIIQQIGSTDNMPRILQFVREAYSQHTGLATISQEELQSKLGDYGASLLSSCSAQIPCIVEKIRPHFSTPLGLFLGIGGLEDTILVNFLLVDLRTTSEIMRFTHTFNKLQEIPQQIPQLMQKLFPNYAALRFQGLPPEAKIQIDQHRYTATSEWIPVPAQRLLSVEITAPEHENMRLELQLAPGQRETRTITMKKVAVVKAPTDDKTAQPPPLIHKKPPPPVAKEWYKNWVVWTITGGVVALGIGVGITAAVLSRNKRNDADGFIPIEVPGGQIP